MFTMNTIKGDLTKKANMYYSRRHHGFAKLGNAVYVFGGQRTKSSNQKTDK